MVLKTETLHRQLLLSFEYNTTQNLFQQILISLPVREKILLLAWEILLVCNICVYIYIYVNLYMYVSIINKYSK